MEAEASVTPVSSGSTGPAGFSPLVRLKRRVKKGSFLSNKYYNALTSVMVRNGGGSSSSDSDSNGNSNGNGNGNSNSSRSGSSDAVVGSLSSIQMEKKKQLIREEEFEGPTRSATPDFKARMALGTTDSSLSLYSESTTLVGMGAEASALTGADSSSTVCSVPASSAGGDVWSTDVKEFIRNYNHASAYELGQSSHLHYYQLPFPYRENKYIIHGYRFYDSHRKSFLSVLNWYGWHNETSNIWTHMLGGVYLLYLSLYDFPHSAIWHASEVPAPAKYIVYVFLMAAIKCMFASVFWHTFNGTHQLKLRCKFACVDYTGITVLITASILTVEFVTMYDHKRFLMLYLTLSLSLGIMGVFMNWSPKFDRPEARPLRIKFFVLLATVGVSSFVQLVFMTNWRYATGLLTPVTNKSVVWYLIGVFFYGSFIPERFRTDVLTDKSIPTEKQLSTDLNIVTEHRDVHFRQTPTSHPKSVCCATHAQSLKSLWWVDYFGCSHTLWHFFVLLGVIGHYNAIIEMFTKRWIL